MTAQLWYFAYGSNLDPATFLGRRRMQPSDARRAVLDGRARLCQELAPEKILDRGFSITRGASGAIIRDPARVSPGERLETRLAGGVLISRAEEET